MVDTKDWDDLYNEEQTVTADTDPPKEDPPADPPKDGDGDGDGDGDPNLNTKNDLINKDGNTDGDPGDAGDVGDGKDGKKPEDDTPPGAEMSGIERYLSLFDIEGGMIKFDDESSTHFNELDAEKQEQVLAQLHSSIAGSVEKKYGLDEAEIGLINHLRKNRTTVEEMVESKVQERMGALATGKSEVDYEAMSDEEIYTQFVTNANKEASEEDISKELEAAKELSTYKGVVESMRNQFKAAQDAAKATIKADEAAANTKRVEEDRQIILSTVTPLKSIAGVELTNNLKNEVLDKVLGITDDGDSIFQDEIFSDPSKLFHAAFLYYNAEKLLAERDTYWKKEKSAAYKRGREDVLGKPGAPISFTDNTKSKENPTGNPDPDKKDKDKDWDDLHEM